MNNEKPLLVLLVVTALLALFLSQSQLHYSVTFSFYEDTKQERIFKPKRNFLVFANVGERGKPALESWLSESSTSRKYDLVLNFFEPNTFHLDNCPADYCFRKDGFKWPSLYYFLVKHRLSRDSYQAIFAVDDDILINSEDINLLFDTFMDHNLLFAQPSYAGDVSDLHFPRIQRWRGNTIIRYSNFVENAAIVIKFSILIDQLLPVLKLGGSGWGVDYCFFKVVDVDILDVATIHTVKAIHPPSTNLTRASNAYGVESKKTNKYGGIVARKEGVNKNRIEGEKLMEQCGALMYLPKIFFRIAPNDNRDEVIRKQKENFPKYRGSFFVESPW